MIALDRLKIPFYLAVALLLVGCGEDEEEPVCGNGAREADEACDDGNPSFSDYCLPTCVLAHCGDGFLLQGVEQCDDGNDIEDDGCTNACSLPRCGDGIVQTGETCDDGNLDERDGCLTNCALPRCGDGTVQADEECDDGNSANTDHCLDDCTLASCGDGFVWLDVEACDDGDIDDDDGCTNRCALPTCGDGLVQPEEDCDDGNLDNTDDCLNTCLDAHCGDGFLRRDIASTEEPEYEECDDGNQSNHDGCLVDCTEAGCGDGYLWLGVEQCDDGNLLPGDDCSPFCLLSQCGDGVVQAGEQCDDGNANPTDGCLNTCTRARCGDGFVQRGVEQCDDGNLDNTDSCLAGCTLATCPDGFVLAGVEQCDDGNANENDACSSRCTYSYCGDGFVWAGVERCDDGNRSNTDSCLVDCIRASCGDGFVWAGVERCDDGNRSNTDSCLASCVPARCGDGFVWDGVEECDDSNQDSTDTCLANCHEFLWCEGYGILQILPRISCEGYLPDYLTIVGTTGFYWIDGIEPTVTLYRPDGLAPLLVDPTFVEDSCIDLTGLLADVQQCQTMTVPFAYAPTGGSTPDLPTGDYLIEVIEPLTAGCSDLALYSVGPAPTLSSVDPTPVCAGERLLTFYGSGFVSETIIQLIRADGASVLEPIETDLQSENEILATFGGLYEGWYDAYVTNGDERCSAMLEDALEVVPDPLAVFAEPSVLFNEIAIRITVYLSDLSADRIIFVGIREKDSIGPYLPLTYYFDPAEKGEVQADVPAGLDPGVYDLVVLDSAQCMAPLYEAFRVTDNDNINLTEIDPPFGWSQTTTAVTILAEDDPADPVVNTFVSLPSVYLTPTAVGTGAVATRLSAVGFLSSTEITALVVPGPSEGLPPGQYTVIVVNPEGSAAEVGVLEGAFTITALAPPIIDLVAPSTIPRQWPQFFTIEGENFRDPTVTLWCQDRDGVEMDPMTVQRWSYTETLFEARVDATTGAIAEGWSCVVRLANGDDGSYGEFSALAFISPSLNPDSMLIEPDLVTARRAHAVTGGQATGRAQFLYVMGGEGGTSPYTALSSVEVGQLDRYGFLVPPDEAEPDIGFSTLREDRWLPAPRSFAVASTVGHFIYLVGGNIGGDPTDSVIRAEILRPEDAPPIRRVRLRVVDATEPGLAEPGVYYYRLAAVMLEDDPHNPGGETLASDPQPVRIPTLVDDTGAPLYVQVTIRWARQEGDPTLYRIYRSPMPAASTGTERLLAEWECAEVGEESPCFFIDDGTIAMTGNEEEPRRLGDIGVWVDMPSLLYPRQGLGLARGEEPDDLNHPDVYYLYAVAGLGTAVAAEDPIRNDYEYLAIQIGTDGSQQVATGWQYGLLPPGTDPGQPNLLRQGRWQMGAYTVDRTVTDRLANRRDNFIFAGGGHNEPDGGPAQDLVKDMDSALITSGGLLTGWAIESDANNRAGYGYATLGGQMYQYGGRAAQPSDTGDSVEVCETGPTDVCPTIANWNNASVKLEDRLYLLGSTVMSARIFFIGGENDTGLVDMVQSLVW